MAQIAGHTFADTPTGRRCVGYASGHNGLCMNPWLHVRTCREADVGVTAGLSHVGYPNIMEYKQICAEKEREESAVWQATIDAASSGSR